MIRQICSIKPQDVATVRSSELLAKLKLVDLDLILREGFTGLGMWSVLVHGLQSLPPPKRAERKVRRRPFQEAGSGHKQWNTVSCVDTFSIISKFSAQNSKI